jgi:hypothetical protein
MDLFLLIKKLQQKNYFFIVSHETKTFIDNAYEQLCNINKLNTNHYVLQIELEK